MQEIYTLNAFANIKAGGNPAAVMLDADNLNKKQMQEMVRMHLGLTEVPKPDDCADALAAAIMCALTLRGQ